MAASTAIMHAASTGSNSGGGVLGSSNVPIASSASTTTTNGNDMSSSASSNISSMASSDEEEVVLRVEEEEEEPKKPTSPAVTTTQLLPESSDTHSEKEEEEEENTSDVPSEVVDDGPQEDPGKEEVDTKDDNSSSSAVAAAVVIESASASPKTAEASEDSASTIVGDDEEEDGEVNQEKAPASKTSPSPSSAKESDEEEEEEEVEVEVDESTTTKVQQSSPPPSAASPPQSAPFGSSKTTNSSSSSNGPKKALATGKLERITAALAAKNHHHQQPNESSPSSSAPAFPGVSSSSSSALMMTQFGQSSSKLHHLPPAESSATTISEEDDESGMIEDEDDDDDDLDDEEEEEEEEGLMMDENGLLMMNGDEDEDDEEIKNGFRALGLMGNVAFMGEEKFKCPVCGLKLDSQHTFTLHIRSHNPNDHSNTCRLCGKTLSSASSLDRHMLIHSGERPFKCSICNMAFTTNGNMHRHMRTHGHGTIGYTPRGAKRRAKLFAQQAAKVAAAAAAGEPVDAATISKLKKSALEVTTGNGKSPISARKFTTIQKRRLVKLGLSAEADPESLSAEQKKDFARLDIDPATINWHRVVDMNDRYLRQITIGEAPSEKGLTRSTGFDISVASELMAILALANSLADAKSRISSIVVAFSKHSPARPVTCDDLGLTGAVTALLKDAIKPTLIQTLEHTPIFVHCGPFANIAHGSSSAIADKIALDLVGREGIVLTEGGFGADIGLEKAINIKCRATGLKPDAAVIVATVRALKCHGGGPPVTPGAVLAKEYREENVELLSKGLVNLKTQIENISTHFKLPVVVAINRFSTDTDAELDLVKSESLKFGAFDAVITRGYELGGAGVVDLAKAVERATKEASPGQLTLLYDNADSIKEKIEKVAKNIYRAGSVEYSEMAEKKIQLYEKMNYGNLPVCIAKTQLSISHDPSLKGAPSGYVLPIKDIKVFVGAGFLTPLCGEIQTMPGLATRPAFYDIDIDPETGVIEGLF